MRKSPRRYISAHAVIALVLGLGLASGCAFTGSGHLLEDIPVSPSSVYVPHSPLPKTMSIQDDQTAFREGRVLSLAQCMEIALSRNPATRESWQRARSAAAGVGQARSSYLPSADFTAGANRSDPVSLDGQHETGPGNTFDAGFGVRYLLFNGGARSAGLKGAEAELLAADFQHNVTLQDVALKVEEAYYRLLASRQLEQVAEETVRQAQYHVDLARARHENGLVARSDVLKAGTEKANADLLLVRARSEVRIARGSLANAMGLKPSESFEVAELSCNPHEQEPADIKRLMADAVSGRPGLRAALSRVESARAKVKAVRARYWPKITLNADYGWRDRTFVPESDEWTLGLGLTWPLFDGFNREFTIRRAKSDLAGSVAGYEKLLRGVELEVWTAYSQLIEADQAIEAARALVASAEESARVTEGEYKNGTASIIEVTDGQTVRTTANVRLVQARLDWYTALARLERAVGRTLANGGDNAINGENSH
ncbi:MAG: TolC family protein [Deltaproteobacteria bacterium]|nr:TolC family protein [Deltaproteobacteria bacterium]